MTYNIYHNALCIVSGANMVSDEDLLDSIKGLKRIIGTGYYDDPDGDKLLQSILTYLESKISS